MPWIQVCVATRLKKKRYLGVVGGVFSNTSQIFYWKCGRPQVDLDMYSGPENHIMSNSNVWNLVEYAYVSELKRSNNSFVRDCKKDWIHEGQHEIEWVRVSDYLKYILKQIRSYCLIRCCWSRVATPNLCIEVISLDYKPNTVRIRCSLPAPFNGLVDNRVDDLARQAKGVDGLCQFHQHFTSMKAFCTAFTCLQFGYVIFGKRKLAKKLLVKCWWNWRPSCWPANKQLERMMVTRSTFRLLTIFLILYPYLKTCLLTSLSIWLAPGRVQTKRN